MDSHGWIDLLFAAGCGKGRSQGTHPKPAASWCSAEFGGTGGPLSMLPTLESFPALGYLDDEEALRLAIQNSNKRKAEEGECVVCCDAPANAVRALRPHGRVHAVLVRSEGKSGGVPCVPGYAEGVMRIYHV